MYDVGALRLWQGCMQSYGTVKVLHKRGFNRYLGSGLTTDQLKKQLVGEGNRVAQGIELIYSGWSVRHYGHPADSVNVGTIAHSAVSPWCSNAQVKGLCIGPAN